MAKTIKLTFYNPKELWMMFWNWAFWPRRKKCQEWVEFFQARLEHAVISDLLIGKYYNEGAISDAVAENLELDIRQAIKEKCHELKVLMVKPIGD